MLHFAHSLLTYVTLHWAAISSLIGGGAALSVILQYVLHKLHIDSKKLAYTLIHVLSIVAALAAYYVDNKSVLPAYAGLAIVAQTVHRFAVSPYYNKYVLPYLTFLSENSTTVPAQSQAAPEAPAVAPSFVS
jgi:hypothetical protein